jgi:hypothetical protein
MSGDSFAELCEFRFETSDDFKDIRSYRDLSVVFCKSELLEFFVSEKPRNLKPQVILVGNSDRDFHEIADEVRKSFRFILLQNSFVSDQKNIFTLPIGLENLKLYSNGIPKHYERSIPDIRRKNFICGPFGNTHPSRLDLRVVEEHRNVTRVTRRLKHKAYVKTLESFRYNLCPRGNGRDTHRVWESLYRGTIPVMIEDQWSKSLKKFGYDFSLIQNWSAKDIDEIVTKQDSRTPTAVGNNPLLWIPFWKKFIKTLVL